MGAYYDIVNPSKRQYLSIASFDENFKWSGLVTGHGQSIHSMAVTWLCCRFQGWDPEGLYGLNGTWSGDIIYFASDEASPDLDGIPTSTPEEPDRNLLRVSDKEYEDITPLVIRDLCEKDNEIAKILVSRVNPSSVFPSLLHELGRIAIHLGCGEVESALQARFGDGWRKMYEEAESRIKEFSQDEPRSPPLIRFFR